MAGSKSSCWLSGVPPRWSRRSRGKCWGKEPWRESWRRETRTHSLDTRTPHRWRRQWGRAKSPSTLRGGAPLGRRLMTRWGWRRSRHFLESPAGAARCTQCRSREPRTAAMSHQTGIQGNVARRGPQGKGLPGSSRRAGRAVGLARPESDLGVQEVPLSGRTGPRSLCVLVSRELPACVPASPGPPAATLQMELKFAGVKEICFRGGLDEGGVPFNIPDICPTFPLVVR